MRAGNCWRSSRNFSEIFTSKSKSWKKRFRGLGTFWDLVPGPPKALRVLSRMPGRLLLEKHTSPTEVFLGVSEPQETSKEKNETNFKPPQTHQIQTYKSCVCKILTLKSRFTKRSRNHFEAFLASILFIMCCVIAIYFAAP